MKDIGAWCLSASAEAHRESFVEEATKKIEKGIPKGEFSHRCHEHVLIGGLLSQMSFRCLSVMHRLMGCFKDLESIHMG